jgi:hypothetical protein
MPIVATAPKWHGDVVLGAQSFSQEYKSKSGTQHQAKQEPNSRLPTSKVDELCFLSHNDIGIERVGRAKEIDPERRISRSHSAEGFLQKHRSLQNQKKNHLGRSEHKAKHQPNRRQKVESGSCSKVNELLGSWHPSISFEAQHPKRMESSELANQFELFDCVKGLSQ